MAAGGVAMATAGFERGLLLRSPARFQAAARKAGETIQAKTPIVFSSGIKEQVLQAWGDTERFTAATYALVAQVDSGASISSEASANKIFWSEMDRAMHRTAHDNYGHACRTGRRRRARLRMADGWMVICSALPVLSMARHKLKFNAIFLPEARSRSFQGNKSIGMNLIYTSDQQELIDAADGFFTGEHTVEYMRQFLETDTSDTTPSLWDNFC